MSSQLTHCTLRPGVFPPPAAAHLLPAHPPPFLRADLDAQGLAALAALPATAIVAVSGNARIGKSTLLNELVRLAEPARAAAAPFRVGASAMQVTAGIDLFTANAGGGGGGGGSAAPVVTFLDAEGRGGHGQEHDARIVALPFASASALVFFTEKKPGAVADNLRALSNIVTSTVGVLEAQPMPHLALCFQDCALSAGEAGDVGKECFGKAWKGAGTAKTPCPDEPLASMVAGSFSSITIHFIPHVQAAGRGAAVQALWRDVSERLRAPAAGDVLAGCLSAVLQGMKAKKAVHVPSGFQAVLREAGQARWRRALQGLCSADSATWKAAWRALGSSSALSGSALLENVATRGWPQGPAAPPAPLTLAQARPLLASLRATPADEAAVEAAVLTGTVAPLRANVERWVTEENAAARAEEQRRRAEAAAAEEAAQRERLRQEQAAAQAAAQRLHEAQQAAAAAAARADEAERRRPIAVGDTVEFLYSDCGDRDLSDWDTCPYQGPNSGHNVMSYNRGQRHVVTRIHHTWFTGPYDTLWASLNNVKRV